MTELQPDPAFAHMSEPHGEFELGGYDSLANFGWDSAEVHPVPASLSNRKIVFNNLAAPWGERGPKWGIRAYNVVGKLVNLELWRCGDWTQGREGHAVYLNVAGDLLIDKLRGVQNGGQLLQLVWRPGETKMPQDLWPSVKHLIDLRNLISLDNGAINFGQSVRASWPISIFSPGSRVHIKSPRISTELADFTGDHGERCKSHGALLVTEGEYGQHTPELVVDDLKARLVLPDRSSIRLSGADAVVLRYPDIEVLGGEGIATLSVVDSCKSIRIVNAKRPIRAQVFHASQPWNSPYQQVTIPVGGRFDWTKP